ncbi:zinc finger SWIM domain protein [Methylocaldum marinum]|uniref:Zinc finger SWIM domain protein n=2 Tax=Methylocaldum marinum TaxID=1432792 RepID=A0A250KW39_9GAMM|nr:zinc finger SWIM domain protein [Methylocaldum marinum]
MTSVAHQNVYLGPSALGRLRDDESVAIAVGRDGVELERAGETLVEKRVRLPVRWVKGFSDVQVYQPGLRLFCECSGAEARRFLRSVPRNPAAGAYLARSGNTLRLSQLAVGGGMRVGGLHRLRVLDPLLGRIAGLRIWGYADAGVSAWDLNFGDARLFLLLSPEVQRGFSGEGQALQILAGGGWEGALARVRAELRWQAELDPARLAGNTGLGEPQVAAVLTALGARGLAGFDVTTQRYFHRELPFDLERIESFRR